jgi:hypothetical protein
MDADEVSEHFERELAALYQEFSDRFPQAQIERLCRARLDVLMTSATVFDYVPLLAYRATREELLVSRPEELHRSA